jgi:hypothetical protein
LPDRPDFFTLAIFCLMRWLGKLAPVPHTR